MHVLIPMITLFKTLDVANLVRQNRKHGRKFSMLMCWYIGRADSELQEFYLLPVGEKLMRLDRLAVNTVVSTQDGSINTCGVPFNEELEQFERNDLTLTRQFQDTGAPYDLGGAYMVVGTSALAQTELDGAVNICAGFYNNPFLIWGRYRKHLFKRLFPASFLFHHTQMDGRPRAGIPGGTPKGNPRSEAVNTGMGPGPYQFAEKAAQTWITGRKRERNPGGGPLVFNHKFSELATGSGNLLRLSKKYFLTA